MAQFLIFLGFSSLLGIILVITEWYKKIKPETLIGLILFGALISMPFILIEHLGLHIHYYFVILAFIAIELIILYCEHNIKYFHDLLHHNIKHLRILSFFLVGMGFAYCEVSFHIFYSGGSAIEILKGLPMKTVYALFMHTILASAASLSHMSSMVTESVYETILKFASYYARIAAISLSHLLYVFSTEYHFKYLAIPLLIGGIMLFFYVKETLDSKKTRA
jgi:hypothetical protein